MRNSSLSNMKSLFEKYVRYDLFAMAKACVLISPSKILVSISVTLQEDGNEQYLWIIPNDCKSELTCSIQVDVNAP